MSRLVWLVLVVIASCGTDRSCQRSAQFVATPFPEDDPRLRFEAAQLDAAQRIASPERFEEMFVAADTRLQDLLGANLETAVGGWCILYVGDGLALRAVRFGEREDWQSAIEHYETLESVYDSYERFSDGLEAERRILAAARAARARIDAQRLPAR